MGSVDHLCSLSKRCFIGTELVSQMRLHRSKCSDVIENIIYLHFKASLRKDVGDGYFSVRLDESMDISVSK